MERKRIFLFTLIIIVLSAGGCISTKGNVGNMSAFKIPAEEALWIRNGEPVEFEGDLWYPHDGFDALLDNEVYLLGEYRDVQYFAEKSDVRPYNQLYTKFGSNKYRVFKKMTND